MLLIFFIKTYKYSLSINNQAFRLQTLLSVSESKPLTYPYLENLEEKHAPHGYLSFASAITSSILSFTTELYIIAFSFGILAVIFGAIGLKKKPKALAIVGLILVLLEVIIPVFILLALLFIIDQVN